MDDNMIEKKDEMVFCRLCAKHKKADEFLEFKIGRAGSIIITITGCKSCEVVIHNAFQIIQEGISEINKKMGEIEKPRIIAPTFIPPKNLKGGPVGQG